MKIGILTLPLKSNYGGLLQAFALQKTLENRGHEVYMINRRSKEHSFLWKILSFIIRYIISVFKKSPKPSINWITAKERAIIAKNTNRFINENINLTEVIDTQDKFSFLKRYNLDSCVVGSDQVWRPAYTPVIGNYFFDFLSEFKNVKKLSYAASFGIEDWTFSTEETSKCSELASKFDAISVREDEGVELCKSRLGVDAVKTLDPTLLIDKNEYINLVKKDNVTKAKHGILCYILDESEENLKIINKVSDVLNLKPFIVKSEKNIKNLKKKSIKSYVYPPVTEWLSNFINAEFVVTDSFHGTIFSIIFNKQFISIGNKKRGLSRFNSILHLLGLESRLIFKADDIIDALINENIDFSNVNQKLDIERKKSLAFLENNI
ncbi:polysaccharide pyruvyl transferase [Maribacter vaceletii]|uniref:Polysaccharide pyruvyl transferase n=1 Tax=Maribacter vaceletii TaxID=1206816 RepID=A0A495DSQ7_9FLAO|nr:polysaccharide pyruvyl transferase family protein [Maribacter vaceletii]RKR07175.1 polysaccharide pyruvyl transferase [Maribacter vaceletii]